MAQNGGTFEQGATIMNELYNQATGTKTLAPVNTSEFISMGYDSAESHGRPTRRMDHTDD